MCRYTVKRGQIIRICETAKLSTLELGSLHSADDILIRPRIQQILGQQLTSLTCFLHDLSILAHFPYLKSLRLCQIRGRSGKKRAEILQPDELSVLGKLHQLVDLAFDDFSVVPLLNAALPFLNVSSHCEGQQFMLFSIIF